MRYLAIARFRLLTLVRTATPMFIIAIIPLLLAVFPAVIFSEPLFREGAADLLDSFARIAVFTYLLHAVVLSFAVIMTGKAKTIHDDVTLSVLPDLMDTAPAAPHHRFWGEMLGTYAVALIVHVCCVPLLAGIVALQPLPTRFFLGVEAVTLLLLFLASASAAWQRRTPRTKYSGTRGPRNAMVILLLLFIVVAATTRWETFRDALVGFLYPHTTMHGWADVIAAIDNPMLFVMLVCALCGGTIAYYYYTATRKRVWEN